MKTMHKMILLAGLAGAVLSMLKRQAVRQRESDDAVRGFDDEAGMRNRTSVDDDDMLPAGDVPVVQAAEPYEVGQPRQPQDLRIVQNVLE